jgi:hypothetical protein
MSEAAACGLALLLVPHPAVADQSDELTRLRGEAAQQRRDLQGIESRIRALEQGSAEPAPALPATQDSTLVQLKKNWSQIEPGIPQDRVRALLGPPQKVMRIDGALVWYYVYPGLGPASVFFNAREVVSSRQAPSFGWW